MRRYKDRPRGFTTSSLILPGGFHTVSPRTAVGVIVSALFAPAQRPPEASEETVAPVVEPSNGVQEVIIFEEPTMGVTFSLRLPPTGGLDEYVEVEALDYLAEFCASIVGAGPVTWDCQVEETLREVMVARSIGEMDQ